VIFHWDTVRHPVDLDMRLDDRRLGSERRVEDDMICYVGGAWSDVEQAIFCQPVHAGLVEGGHRRVGIWSTCGREKIGDGGEVAVDPIANVDAP
jgi:hypothetical protein